MRITEKLVNEKWIEVDFSCLEEGDTFRNIDNGELWINEDGESEFVAASDPFIDDDGYWRIRIE